MIATVEALMREVAETAILPRFRHLKESEVSYKGPADLVTVADQEAEALLTARLPELIPGSRVVGEEAASADPSLIATAGEPGHVWVIDPVDGTANFASGQEPFAVMVALLKDSQPIAGWILDPVSGIAAVAERGSGAYIGGARVTTANELPADHRLRGPAHRLAPLARGPVSTVEITSSRNCVGWDYPAILRGEQQFALFWKTLVWDHAAGILLVEEAGGVAWRLDGTPYDVTDDRSGLLVAQNQATWDATAAALLTT
jgi:fructose-1,6-bisphosphatase/inositol monophosphatase family enzyme